MEPLKKKNVLDIFDSTSANLSGGLPTIQAPTITKPRLASANPAAAPAQGQSPSQSFETANRQTNGVQFKPGANIRSGNGVSFNNTGSPAPIAKIDALTSANKFGQAMTQAADTAYDTSFNAAAGVANKLLGSAQNLYRGTQGQSEINTPVIALRNSNGGSGSSPSTAPNPAGMVPPAIAKTTPSSPQNPFADVNSNFASTAPVINVAPGSVAASVNAAGNPTYDNSSIAKLEARNGVGAQPKLAQAVPTDVPALSVDPQAVAGQTVAAQRGQTLTARNDATRLLNPMSNEAELLRRIEIAGGGSKGSPSTRRAIMEALSGQMNAGNVATAQGQQAGNAALANGQDQLVEGASTQQKARSAIVAEQIRQQGEQRLAQLNAENSGGYDVGADGTKVRISGNQAATVLDSEGNAFKPQQTKASAEGQVTPALQYKAVSDRIAALEQSPISAEEKAAALVPLQAQLQSLTGTGGGGYPEGSKIRGPDNKIYVVKDGQPVLEK